MTARPIALEGAARPEVVDLVRATIATLPQTFAIVEGRAAAIVLDGAGGWAERGVEAIARGARALLVVNPSPAERAEIDALLRTGVPVVLDSPWRHSTALKDAAPYFQSLDGAGRLLECSTTVRSPEQLRKAARSLAFAAQALMGFERLAARDIVRRPSQLLVLATTSSRLLVRISAVVGPEPTARAGFRLVGSDSIAKLTLAAPDSGETGVVEFTDDRHTRILPSAFESSHRSTLRFLREVIDGDATTSDLADIGEVGF